MAKEVNISGLSPGVAIKSATSGAAWLSAAALSGTKYRIEAEVNNTLDTRSASVTFLATDNATSVLPVTQTPATGSYSNDYNNDYNNN
jgi:hypothetical protein